MLEFEWDDAKAAANERKHGVTFPEAATAFADLLAAIFPDPDHSEDEARDPCGVFRAREVAHRQFHRAAAKPPDHQRPRCQPDRAPQPRAKPDGRAEVNDELRDEYQFDYRKANPNRFASAVKNGGRLVVLDPEVAAAFRESGAVNAVLRALLQTMPGPPAVPVPEAEPSAAPD